MNSESNMYFSFRELNFALMYLSQLTGSEIHGTNTLSLPPSIFFLSFLVCLFGYEDFKFDGAALKLYFLSNPTEQQLATF